MAASQTKASRRVGAAKSETRAQIVDATQAVILKEGYGAASTRRVAREAGLNPSLVHYYFPTTDDLLLAALKKGAAQSDVMIEEALASDTPLQSLWRFFADTSRTAMSMEFIALANHRPAIREEMARHSEQMRARQSEFLTRYMADTGVDLDGIDPAVMTVIMAGVGRTLVMESNMGVEAGHTETRQQVENWLNRFTAPDVVKGR